ncbi:zinc-binding dehydrogenase [Klenkia sp. PcliD-1-E]|uniref:zinc-binding dehydrogenase n=1 Tax=Klenkia sp. PcliD-1-E TaxID=2954492 RepID=UPI002097BFD4|nr:zinc-binding dehydrogenase [Klenkia sp. PcliD-1-E]MCO7219235.1 zinc-binding dehydrogenase [Klenkia sp. PcliD-1-E]
MSAPGPATMTAALLTAFGGPDVLAVRHDVPVPAPGPGEARVRVRAAALNNTDVWTREGAYGTAEDPDAQAGWLGPVDFPRIQGADVAGVVDAVGPGVTPGLVGRRVLLDPARYADDGPHAPVVAVLGSEFDGGFAEFVVVDALRAHDVTTSPLSDEQLACLPIAYGTATGMLERAGVSSGQTVLVTGASGGVGLAAVALAAARGADVTAVTSAAKASAVREAGATTTVDRAGSPRDVVAAVRAVHPDGVDVVVDVVGGDQLGQLVDVLLPGGRAVVAGAVAGPVTTLDLRRLYLHNRQLVGSTMHTAAHFARLVEHARSGDVRPRVAARYPLAEIHRAQERFLRRDHVGKVVLVPEEASPDR